MNKYEIIKLMKREYNSIYDEMTDDEIVVLKDILERATPKKVVRQSCPSCETYLSLYFRGNFKHCPYCSQHLDWSE